MLTTPIELRATRGAPFVIGLLAGLPIAMIAMVPEKPTVLVCGAIVCVLVAAAVTIAFRLLIVDEQGVTAKGLLGTRRLHWNEITSYRFWSYELDLKRRPDEFAPVMLDTDAVIHEAVAVGIGAVDYLERGGRARGADNRRFGSGTGSGRLTLRGRGGRRIVVDGRYRDAVLALDVIFAEVHERLRAEARQSYQPFSLDGKTLAFRGRGAIELAEIDQVSVQNDRITVRKRAGKPSWAASMKRIDNSALLLQELARRGVAVRASAGVFVPQPPSAAAPREPGVSR